MVRAPGLLVELPRSGYGMVGAAGYFIDIYKGTNKKENFVVFLYMYLYRVLYRVCFV